MTPFRRWPLVLAAALLALPALAAEPGRLTVRADQPGPKISPVLWGIFYEEINCSGDGGLYAELVRNRSFEDNEKPVHWTLVCRGGGRGEMEIDTAKPVSDKNRRSLRVAVEKPGDGVGAINDGWWGMGLKEGAAYTLSLHTRGADGFTGPLRVTLENVSGSVHAEATVPEVGPDWKRHTLTLTSRATDPHARLVITGGKAGTFWLDVVSLFPQSTWKNRPNGLRPDLAEMLAGLKPSFVRFPGGCWVEGDRMELASRWKRTIGDIGDRWTQWNIWDYSATNGLGYHEYLQMCEDLGAEPLFVINCGMSHRENVPMDKMGEFVQDALDAIEYANGPADSTWGALRAKAGHPAPFNMKYLEIGNENGGRAYHERYALFHDAIKAKYPQMHLVANEWSGIPSNRPVEIVDEHYYSTPEFFMQNATKYDSYKRDGHKVYVGEYAVTQNCGQGNLRAALGEAAFMTGMERNSDVVIMASYAPLFVNMNHRRWNPDLINFDSSRVYGLPSYHVQKMFSEHRGDVVLPVTVEPQPAAEEPQKGLRGAVGVGTWMTQAEFKEIRVTQGEKVLLENPGGTKGWRLGHGTWKTVDGTLHQASGSENCRATIGDANWTDYTYTVKARKLGGAEGFLILFRVQDEGNWIWWNVGGWGNSHSALERSSEGGKGILGENAPLRVETGRWYDVRVEVKGKSIRCFMDGKLITEATDEIKPLLPVYATASRVQATGEILVKVVNVSDGEQALALTLQGAAGVAPAAAAIVLAGKRADENTLDAPTQVAPVTQAIGNAGATFVHRFPANSFTVLRIRTR
jgi:alpha-L-arabinofuranosidase